MVLFFCSRHPVPRSLPPFVNISLACSDPSSPRCVCFCPPHDVFLILPRSVDPRAKFRQTSSASGMQVDATSSSLPASVLLDQVFPVLSFVTTLLVVITHLFLDMQMFLVVNWLAILYFSPECAACSPSSSFNPSILESPAFLR